MNTLSNGLGRVRKFVLGLIVVLATIISSCEAVNGPGGLAVGDAALSASRAKMGVTYHITSIGDLMNVNNDLAGDYLLDVDLVLSNWIPIGYDRASLPTVVNPFTGTFDGQGHTITVQSFDPAVVGKGKYLGIFAVIGDDEGAPSVSNLNVELITDPMTTSAQYVGGVVGHARDAAFSTINVTGKLSVIQNPNTPTNFNVGGVAGFAASSTFNNITANIGFETVRTVAPALSGLKWEIWRGGDTFKAYAVIDSEIAITGEDGITTGGVAGTVKFSQFRNITVNGVINARGLTQGTPAYVGGVLGYANGATVDNAQTRVEIRGEGPGYNSSAGGVAGYVINSIVRDSHAEGPVELRGESEDFDWSFSWQVYAGGLVGYAGGSDIGASLVDHNYATGDVNAFAPYPYAGGLVGYLYGFNDFTNPAKNGGTVSRSYATGNVFAISQPDTTPNNNGDIPYTGGLVGYSSVTGSTIKDSYATGNAYAVTEGTYAWAGGLVGGNANDAVVLRTYATGYVFSQTGDRSPLYQPSYAPAGPAAGGIAGFNYYTAATLVSKSVALNGEVYGTNRTTGQEVVHRVVGSLGDNTGHDGTLDDNYANIDMVVDEYWISHIGLDEVDGADMVPVPPQSLYAGLGWDFANIWQLTGNYPTLR
jgi:hypothetical protein